METPRSPQNQNPPHQGMRLGFVLISLAAIGLLAAALVTRSYNGNLPAVLLIVVLIALCASILLHARFLILARREHHETARALDTTEREFKSIFDNALDGIVILDDRGVCLEANPAAQSLLAVQREELVGKPFGKFRAGGGNSENASKHFPDRNHEHGETRLVRKDGEMIFVEYTAKSHYLPDRHVAVLRDISRRKQTEAALRESEERFQQMAGNIEEIFWMLDAGSKEIIYVNQAYETITGRRCRDLRDNPTSYKDLIYPEDRVRVLSRLDKSVQVGQFDEEFRIVRSDGAIRWMWVRGFPVRGAGGVVHRIVGTAQDVSARKSAEAQIARNLDMAESAWAEADAFRKTTLALTQNLSMDYVLDTLLQSLLKLIPCETARVLLVEADARLFLAREVQNSETSRCVPQCPTTFDAEDNRFLMQVLATKNSLLIAETAEEAKWHSLEGYSHLHSWLCVPLVASDQVLGLLSLGNTHAQAFTPEHLRLAKSLAIPAAVAIQNARLFERAEIYGAELEHRLADLEMTQQALRLAEEGRTLSEERFTKIFRSGPVAFSIMTVDDGCFVDVNEAFERRYGYSRDQLIGRTALDVGIWGDAKECLQMLADIRQHGSILSRSTCFKRSSGELIDTIFSAEAIELDGRRCLLAVSEDLADHIQMPSALTHRTTTTH
ncbi:MAG: PAS domain S-box protein [Candidatus Acidiferrales bacterium]